MSFNRSILFAAILLASCTSKKQEPTITWLYGYGQVEKINGRVEKIIVRNIDFTDRYTFNNKGDLVTIENIYKSRIDTTKYQTEYYGNKKILSTGLYFDKGKKIIENYEYDSKGYMIKYYDLSIYNNRFIYDNAGNLIEEQQYFQKKPLWIFKFKYFYRKNSFCAGVEQSTLTWRDNFKGYDRDTTKYIAFDSKKNWLKAVNFVGDTIARTITYY